MVLNLARKKTLGRFRLSSQEVKDGGEVRRSLHKFYWTYKFAKPVYKNPNVTFFLPKGNPEVCKGAVSVYNLSTGYI